MRAVKMTLECDKIACSITPYLDGELDPGHAVDVESHASACPECAERVAFAMALRSSMKRVAGRSMCPSSLRARAAALLAEESRELTPEAEVAARAPAVDDDRSGPKLIRLRYAVALAAAAGVALAMGAARHRHTDDVASADAATQAKASASPAGFETLLDELVALHAQPLPPETTNPEELPRFDPFVGVPVRRPSFHPFGARFNGARVVPAMADRRAALLQYTVSGHRVTVYVFDPRAVPLRPVRLHPRVMHQLPVYSGKLRGYSVAATESQRGVGYALATDLDDDESAKMVMAAALQ
jgi:anti-sigma factor RsiW